MTANLNLTSGKITNVKIEGVSVLIPADHDFITNELSYFRISKFSLPDGCVEEWRGLFE